MKNVKGAMQAARVETALAGPVVRPRCVSPLVRDSLPLVAPHQLHLTHQLHPLLDLDLERDLDLDAAAAANPLSRHLILCRPKPLCSPTHLLLPALDACALELHTLAHFSH